MPADDFDFLFRRWDVRHHKLRDTTDPGCTEWVDFAGTCEAWPLLSTGGHADRLVVPAQPGTEAFEGSTLRLLDPATDLWSIHWSSTRSPGSLEPPVVGRYDGDVGTFTGAEVVGGGVCWCASPGTAATARGGSRSSPPTPVGPGP